MKKNNELPNKVFDAVILAVSHDLFKKIEIDKILIGSNSIIYDIKGFFNKESVTKRL